MPTPFQLEEARRRQQLVEALPRYPSLKAAAAGLGEPIANLSRYRTAWEKGRTVTRGGESVAIAPHSLEALMPETDQAGRPALAGVLSEEEIAFARTRYLLTESLPLAIEALADSPVCTHRSRELLNRYRDSRDYPPSVYKALRVTAEEWAEYRGDKKRSGHLFSARRGMFIIDEQGQRREVVAGDIFEGDDVSVDCPYYVQLPDGTFRAGRQALCSMDLRTEAFKGVCAVARERDSYRAEDIVRFTRWLVESHGLPGRFRWERGSWESDAVQGLKLPDGRRWGGITQLVPVDHCYSSNGKANIESRFRMLHKVLGLHGVRIGKTRGEYAQPTADMIAVNEGRKHPAECGFIAWADLLAKFEAAFALLNGRARYDRHTGEFIAPDDLWARDMQARPGKRLPVCPEALKFHFLPVKRIVGVGTLRAGQVSVSLPDYRQPFLFRVAGHDAAGRELPYLERGHRVIVAFDPHEAAAGARIYNIDDSARNRAGHRLLEELCVAPLWEDSAQLDLSGRSRAGEPGADARKTRRQQVRAAFTSIGSFGQGARRVHHSHDGDGQTQQVAAAGRSNLSPSAAAPAPAVVRAAAPRRAAPVVVEDFTAAPELSSVDRATPAPRAAVAAHFFTPPDRRPEARPALADSHEAGAAVLEDWGT